jgi:hypothetical protein
MEPTKEETELVAKKAVAEYANILKKYAINSIFHDPNNEYITVEFKNKWLITVLQETHQ